MSNRILEHGRVPGEFVEVPVDSSVDPRRLSARSTSSRISAEVWANHRLVSCGQTLGDGLPATRCSAASCMLRKIWMSLGLILAYPGRLRQRRFSGKPLNVGKSDIA
jgi:hypothetical protein